MKIIHLSPDGVLKDEQPALKEIERAFPKEWLGFSAFQLVQQYGNALDIDLLMLTPHRVLLVELKNWSGTITEKAGQWYRNDALRGRSAALTATDKARKLHSFLAQKLVRHEVPYVEAVVVMCHPQVNVHLSSPPDKAKTLTLPEFLDLTNKSKYDARYPLVHPEDKRQSVNPLASRTKYETLVFGRLSAAVRPRRIEVQSYQQESDKPDFEHPIGLYSEYFAKHVETQGSRGLIRLWDFSALDGGATTQTQRANIALRELRINERLRVLESPLKESLLDPVGSFSESDVTTNFAEAYRLPTKLERLDVYVNRNKDLEQSQRTLVVQAILGRYAELHELGIAHRDIGLHSVWLREPAMVMMSSFAAAYFPEKATVGIHRSQVEAGSTTLPEDAAGSPSTDPFRRDVFLLGVIAYQVTTGRGLGRYDGVPTLRSEDHDGLPRELVGWFGMVLDRDPGGRPRNAREALELFNESIAAPPSQLVHEADLEPYRTAASPITHLPLETLSQRDRKWVYVSEHSGRKVVVKLWTGLTFDAKRPESNERLLAFLQLARSIKSAPTADLPSIVDFGLSSMGLVLITEWQEGATLEKWAESASGTDRAAVALSLLRAVERLSQLEVAHGDLSMSNVLVAADADGAPSVRFLDIPDLTPDGSTGLTTAFAPADASAMSTENRDRYAAVAIVHELLKGEEPYVNVRDEIARAMSQAEAGLPVDLIAESLERHLRPKQVKSPPRFSVGFTGRPLYLKDDGTFQSDNGCFHVGIEAREKQVVFHISGVSDHLQVITARETRELLQIRLRTLTHSEHVRIANRSKFSVEMALAFESALQDKADGLVEMLYERAVSAGLLENGEEGATEAEVESDDVETAKEGPASSTQVLWRAMADAEEENAVVITVSDACFQDPNDSDLLYVPYSLDEGTIDFEPTERVQVQGKFVDRLTGEEAWRYVASLDVVKSNDARLALRERRNAFSSVPGTSYKLRGHLEEISIQRKRAAMRRILSGEAHIPSLPRYFDQTGSLMPYETPLPTGILWSEYGLNDEQKEAVETALGRGPLSLLQGPPGTGKTKFISAVAHILLTQGLAQRILLVSQSHEAVNHALTKLLDIARKSGRPVSAVRVGQEGQLSAPVRHLHDYYQQQVFREKFVAECKSRVIASAASLGLPSEFLDEATDLYIGLDPIVRDVQSLQKLLEDSKISDKERARTETRLRGLLQTFETQVEGRYGQRTGGREPAAVLHELERELCRKHGRPSPERVKRLRDLVSLASEFRLVLGNPQANFTAFLTKTCQVVAGTCVGIGRSSFGITDVAYDWVIIDEAARSSPTELAVAMQSGRRILLVGDHEQLPPSYTPAYQRLVQKQLHQERVNMSELNDFRRAFTSGYGKTVGRTLTTQYRMASAIGELVSRGFYKGALQTGRPEPGDEYSLLPEPLHRQVVWVDTSDRGRDSLETNKGEGNITNAAEADAVMAVLRLIASAESFIGCIREGAEDEPPIGVICMYAQQRNLIQRRFHAAEWAAPIRSLVKIGTVDSYQGKENRLVILSFVRNNTRADPGFLKLKARVNVAVSRAKDRLVIVGSTVMWSQNRVWAPEVALREVKALALNGRALIVGSQTLNAGRG